MERRNAQRWIAALGAALVLLTGCGLGAPSGSIGSHEAMQARAVPTQAQRLIVKFRTGASDQQVKSVSRYVSATVPNLGLSVVSKEAGAQIQTLESAGALDYVEPDLRMKAQVTLNDPFTPLQWGHTAINASAAWDLALGDPSVIVAVVDTGVDLAHPDLRNRLVPGVSFIAGAGPQDNHGHGTHVAGIIAAEGNNGEGVTGVAPRCRIMPVKVLDAKGEGNTSDIVAGIVWAADHGARVINLSLGGAGGGKSLEAAVAYAQQKGCVVVAAMGNDGDNVQDYPASLPGVIAVGAVNRDGQVAEFSNYGRWISVVAPGDHIYSTLPTQHFTLMDEEPDAELRYGYLSGTSMASPYVAGLAALLCSVAPRSTPAQVKARIEQTADGLGKGFDPMSGWGRINAARALGAIR